MTSAWAAVLAPVVAAAVLAAAPSRFAGWVGLGGTMAALAFACALLLGGSGGAGGLRADALAAGIAVTAAWLAAGEALCLARQAVPRLDRVAPQVALAGTLLALLAGTPVLAWLGLATAAGAGLLAGRTGPAPAAAGTGLAGLGVVLMQAPGGPATGFVLLLAGCAVLASLGARLALPAVALVLRSRGVAGAEFASPPLLAVGLVLLAAAALPPREDRGGPGGLMVGPGLALFAFGLGSPDATAGGLLGLAAGCLATGAVAAWPGQGWMRTVAQMASAGLPPFGVFTAWVTVLAEAARHAPLLGVPLGAGLIGCAWAALRQTADTQAARHDPLRTAAAGLHLAALAALGLGLLPGAQALLAAAAAAAP